MTREPTKTEIQNASIAWCGDKDRETFSEDLEYFRCMWRSLPGLRAYVEREVSASDLREVLADALGRHAAS